MVFPFVWAKYKWKFARDGCKLSFRRSLARSRETRFSRPNRRACSHAIVECSVRFRLGAPNPFARLTTEVRPNRQKWHTISRQFLRISQFKQTGLFEYLRLIHKYALSLLFHLKSWFAEKLNYATAFARVYKQYQEPIKFDGLLAIFTAKCKHYFCRDQEKPLNA